MESIPMPICELCDRLTIVALKLERLPDSEIDKEELKKQYDYYTRGVDFNNPQICAALSELKMHNAHIWDLEYEIRKGLDEQLGYEEIGKRAVKIRDVNRLRVNLKNQISEIAGQSEFKDCKMNHVSENQ